MLQTLLARFEVYLVIVVISLATAVGAYFKGRLDEKALIQMHERAQSEQLLADDVAAAQRRAAADDQARQLTEALLARVSAGLGEVNAKFEKLPSVVLDARGCGALSDSFRLRWSADNAAGLGSAQLGPAGAPGAVQPAAPAGSP